MRLMVSFDESDARVVLECRETKTLLLRLKEASQYTHETVGRSNTKIAVELLSIISDTTDLASTMATICAVIQMKDRGRNVEAPFMSFVALLATINSLVNQMTLLTNERSQLLVEQSWLGDDSAIQGLSVSAIADEEQRLLKERVRTSVMRLEQLSTQLSQYLP